MSDGQEGRDGDGEWYEVDTEDVTADVTDEPLEAADAAEVPAAASSDEPATDASALVLTKIRGELVRLDVWVDMVELARQDEEWKSYASAQRKVARIEAQMLRDEETLRRTRREARRRRRRGEDGGE